MKKIISSILVCVFLLLSCSCNWSCISDESVVPLPDYVKTVRIGKVKESFLCKEENRIKYVAYSDSSSEERFTEDNLPAYRVIMIQDHKTLKEAIEEDLFDGVIDFETETIVVVVFSVYGNYRIGIESVEKQDEVLTVTIVRQISGNATQPVVQTVILRLNKIDIDEIKVNFTK